MTAPNMIGQRILSVRYHHIPKNAEGLEEFHVYLQLSNDSICTIPIWPLEDIAEDMLEEEELAERFMDGKILEKEFSEKIVGYKILDLHFQEGKGLFAKPAYLELENGYYLSEEPYSSQSVGIRLLDKTEFLQKKGLNSYLREIKSK